MNKLRTSIFALGILMVIACGSSTDPSQEVNGGKLTPQAFAQKAASEDDIVLLDVRSPEEFATNHIEGAVNINVNSGHFDEKIQALEKEKDVLVYCKSGGRSAKAAKKLTDLGYTVYDLEGGILNWQSEGMPIVADAKKSNSGFTMASYSDAVARGLVLVDFYATWCGPCKMMAPHVEALDKEYGENLKVVKVDTDKSLEVAQHFKISGIPLVKIYKDGKEVYSQMGYHAKEALKAELEKHS